MGPYHRRAEVPERHSRRLASTETSRGEQLQVILVLPGRATVLLRRILLRWHNPRAGG